MSLTTAFTTLLSVRHPIVLAPMGGPPAVRWPRLSRTGEGWD